MLPTNGENTNLELVGIGSILTGDPQVPTPSIKATFLAGAVRYARRGDHTAFEVLYWHYNKPIWNRLLRLVGNKEVTEELHQETFLRAWIHLSNMRDDTGFGLWLYRVAANLATDYLRHAKKFEFVPFQKEEGEEHCS